MKGTKKATDDAIQAVENSVVMYRKFIGLCQMSTLRPLRLTTIRREDEGKHVIGLMHEDEAVWEGTTEDFMALTAEEILNQAGVPINEQLPL